MNHQTPAQIMDASVKEAKTIMSRHFPQLKEEDSGIAIATSNIAMALFSYVVEEEALGEGDRQLPDDMESDLDGGFP